MGGMTKEEAVKVASKMKREIGGRFGGAGLRKLFALVEGETIVFSGGKFGEHSLHLSATSKERAMAHWRGYVEANGAKVEPSVGERVSFPSASAWRAGGFRNGTVTWVGPVYLRVEFTYASGRKSWAKVPIRECRF